MAEETTPQTSAVTPPSAVAKKPKPPALEDKPFTEFMQQDFTPALSKAFSNIGIDDVKLTFVQDKLPLQGINSTEKYWQIQGTWSNRQFSLYFLDEDIQGRKAFSCGINNNAPSLIESFMIDERKVTLDLMVLYTLQRLNGQKWLTRN